MMINKVFSFSLLSRVNMDSNGRPSTGQILLLATSSALTALFYSVYRNKASSAARLRVRKKSIEIYFGR